ncbi:MAG: hypothetical protein SGI97_06915 [candidate division Zixibacteria bacterium]|nr:hypothetical protein [candidate division Zixibacteria bacterium]
MSKLTMAVVIAGLVVLASSASATLVSEPGHASFYTTMPEAIEQAAAKNQPIVLKFFTDW